tara:strand:- start:11137 stop:12879 length:1743 start_codon:yes stop_codon:yes gene_type:complete
MGDFGDTTITYNSFAFSNAGTWPNNTPAYPVPFVSKTVEYLSPDVAGGEGRWCRKESITLRGQITECDNSGLTLEDKREAIINAFSEDFHTLEIEGLENIELVRVMSVDVGPQEGAKTFIDYSITLESYPEDSFAQLYRVIDPSDTVEVAENEDGTATLTHTVSCRGLNTTTAGGSSNALANAKRFVEEKIGAGCVRGNIIKSKDPAWGKYLVNVSENIDRITADYSMSKTYTSDLTRAAGGEIVVRHTKSIEESWGESRRVVHSGKIDGGRHGTWDDVRKAYKDLKGTFNDPPAVDPFLLSEDIKEDSTNKSISFTITLEKGREEVIDDYNITVSEDSGGSLIRVSIQGTISATGPKACRLKKIRKHFCGSDTCKASGKNINGRYANYCQEAYSEYLQDNDINNLPGDVVFQKDALAINVTENTFAPTIQYSMQFDNRITHGHHKANHNMSFTPSLQHIAQKELNRPNYCVNQNCGGEDDVGGQNSFDLLWMGFRDRCTFGIAGQINVYSAGGSTMENIANNKYRKYCGLTQDEIQTQKSESEDKKDNVSYDYKWSFHSPTSEVNSRGSEAAISQFKIG